MAEEQTKKRKPNAYILALKEFNKGKSMWCIPKKGSEDHKEVTRLKEKLQKGEAPKEAPKEENVIVHTETMKEKEIRIFNEERKQRRIDVCKKINYNTRNLYGDKDYWKKMSSKDRQIAYEEIMTLKECEKEHNIKNDFPTIKSLPEHLQKGLIMFAKKHKIDLDKYIDKKEEPKKEETPSYLLPAEKKYDTILSQFHELEKTKWEKLTPQQKRYVIRSIVDDLPQYAQMLKKKNPFPDMKSLPKYMHKSYSDYLKE